MTKAASIAGGVLAFVIASGLALMEVQGKKLPEPLFRTLAVLAVLAGTSALVVWLWALLLPALRYLRGHHYQWPMVSRGKPVPHQWLLDISQQDSEEPHRMALISERFIDRWDLSEANERPSFRLWVEVFNGNVHSILVRVRGVGTIDGAPLPERIIPDGGEDSWNRIQRGDISPVVFTQFLPKDLVALGHAEVTAGQLTRFGFSQVFLEIQAESEQGPARLGRKGVGGVFKRRN